MSRLDGISARLDALEQDREADKSRIQYLEYKNLSLQHKKQQYQKIRDQLLIDLHKHKLLQMDAIDHYRKDPSLFNFYRTFQVKLEQIFISAKAIAGGFAVVDGGKKGDQAKKISLVGELIGLAPIVGGVAKKLAQGASKVMEWKGKKDQEELAEQIAELMPLSTLMRELQQAAARLTQSFEAQLKNLQDPNDAHVIAEYAVLWVYEGIQEDSFDMLKPFDEQIISLIESKKAQQGPGDRGLHLSNRLGKTVIQTIKGSLTLFDFFRTKEAP